MGDRVEASVGPVAHGGHCVARVDGRVVFVRHALPGERVVAQITTVGPQGRWLGADAVAVLEASPDRVDPPCGYSGPGGCGGCDWQHATPESQRRLKAAVVAEQLLRLGGVSQDVEVAALPDDDGLGWRTRMRYSVTAEGRPGLLGHGTHDVIQVRRCLIADPRIQASDVLRQTWQGCDSVSVVAPSAGGELSVSRHPGPRAAPVTELAGGRTWHVSAGGFWQVHRGGADALRDAVVALGRPGIGEHAVDLYTGVGLLADALAPHLGPGGRVDAVEGDRRAARDARTNLSAAGHAARVVVHEAAVEDFVRGRALRRCDLVVLDPPRRGARRRVVEGLCRWRPRRVVYVACDPASLARDVATFRGLGYVLRDVRGLDLFPMTHHVECVALLVRAGVADREPLELS